MAKKIVKRNLKNGLVGFIDLLGFSVRVSQITTEADLQKLDEDVTFVQNQFEHKSTDELTRESQKIVNKSVLAFSDCLVVAVPLKSELADHEGTFDVLMGELHGFALAQGTCVLNGIFLRRGIDLGFWYHRRDTLISPAMVNAYRLEHDACVPMIALTGGLRSYLAKHPHRQYYSNDYDPFPIAFMRGRELPNGQQQWFINYIGVCLSSIEARFTPTEREAYKTAERSMKGQILTDSWQKNCRKWASNHADAICRAWAAATDDSVRKKYVWLARYHNRETKRFFRENSKPLLININGGALIFEAEPIVAVTALPE